MKNVKLVLKRKSLVDTISMHGDKVSPTYLKLDSHFLAEVNAGDHLDGEVKVGVALGHAGQRLSEHVPDTRLKHVLP